MIVGDNILQELTEKNSSRMQVHNVRRFYTDPKDGKIKMKYFGDGSLNEIQRQIQEFEDSLSNGNSIGD